VQLEVRNGIVNKAGDAMNGNEGERSTEHPVAVEHEG
jgi:hypothetical protein